MGFGLQTGKKVISVRPHGIHCSWEEMETKGIKLVSEGLENKEPPYGQHGMSPDKNTQAQESFPSGKSSAYCHTSMPGRVSTVHVSKQRGQLEARHVDSS